MSKTNLAGKNNKPNKKSLIKKSLSQIKMMDMNRIYEIFGDDTQGIHEFIETFIRMTYETILATRVALHEKNITNTKKNFHTLKGSAGNSGVTKIFELSQTAEQNILSEDWDAADKKLIEIEAAFKSLCDEYETHKKNLKKELV